MVLYLTKNINVISLGPIVTLCRMETDTCSCVFQIFYYSVIVLAPHC